MIAISDWLAGGGDAGEGAGTGRDGECVAERERRAVEEAKASSQS